MLIAESILNNAKSLQTRERNGKENLFSKFETKKKLLKL